MFTAKMMLITSGSVYLAAREQSCAVKKIWKHQLEQLPSSGLEGVRFEVIDDVHHFEANTRNLLENYLSNRLGFTRSDAFDLVQET